MKIIYSEEFRKRFYKLPDRIKKLYRKQENIFKNNWRDKRLQTKKLKGFPFSFSFRITRSYRALFLFVDQETVLFATIGHRKDIYRK
ncbi:hypothetical protein KKD04_03255 [Patescibacteria group bacterium]|nr:hypothetical protein [Patescibacteria group bacterium]